MDDNTASASERSLTIEPPVRVATLTFRPLTIEFSECLTARLELDLDTAMPDSSIRIPFYNSEGLVVAEWNSKRVGLQINLVAGQNLLELLLGPLHLGPGKYDLAVVLNDSTGTLLPFWSLKQHSILVRGNVVGACEYQVPHSAFSSSNTTSTELAFGERKSDIP